MTNCNRTPSPAKRLYSFRCISNGRMLRRLQKIPSVRPILREQEAGTHQCRPAALHEGSKQLVVRSVLFQHAAITSNSTRPRPKTLRGTVLRADDLVRGAGGSARPPSARRVAGSERLLRGPRMFQALRAHEVRSRSPGTVTVSKALNGLLGSPVDAEKELLRTLVYVTWSALADLCADQLRVCLGSTESARSGGAPF